MLSDIKIIKKIQDEMDITIENIIGFNYQNVQTNHWIIFNKNISYFVKVYFKPFNIRFDIFRPDMDIRDISYTYSSGIISYDFKNIDLRNVNINNTTFKKCSFKT